MKIVVIKDPETNGCWKRFPTPKTYKSHESATRAIKVERTKWEYYIKHEQGLLADPDYAHLKTLLEKHIKNGYYQLERLETLEILETEL